MRFVYYDSHRRRVYVLGRHIHHGLDGLMLIVVGLGLVIHDIHDWPFFPERFVKKTMFRQDNRRWLFLNKLLIRPYLG